MAGKEAEAWTVDAQEDCRIAKSARMFLRNSTDDGSAQWSLQCNDCGCLFAEVHDDEPDGLMEALLSSIRTDFSSQDT